MAKRLKKKGGEKGFRDLLIGQFLLAVLLYVAVAFYETSKTLTLVLSFLLLLGIIYFSWKGFKSLWAN